MSHNFKTPFQQFIHNAMRASIENGKFNPEILRNIIGDDRYSIITGCFKYEQEFIESTQKYIDEGRLVDSTTV
jgi:hypothetical protein